MNSVPQLSRSPVVALVGNPNCGKTALFNLLTGSRQKVANYAGVTVERKEGQLFTATGNHVRLFDLPGAYGLEAETPDEKVTLDVLCGRLPGEQRPDLIVCVVDSTNLRQHLRLVVGLRRFGMPMIVALNMSDLALRHGLQLDAAVLSRELGVPVVCTTGTHREGIRSLLSMIDTSVAMKPYNVTNELPTITPESIASDHAEVRRVLSVLGVANADSLRNSDRIDRVVLHPVAGPLILLGCLFLMFQAVFIWAQPLMDGINASVGWLGAYLQQVLPDSMLRSLLIDGVIAGAGSVVVFLPQIIILFFFILVLEESGYLPRAAFLLDKVMGGVGLSGRSFIPLLSSFACAIPGIMATRTIQNPRDRLITIMIAPLMTCSARLPVYALIIAAFIPSQRLWGGVELQGLVLFSLYVGGIVAAMLVAWVMKLATRRDGGQSLMLELPAYHLPVLRNIAIGLWQRVQIFLMRVGTIILSLMVILWFLSSVPFPPEGATGPAIQYSYAGRMGVALAQVFAPIGFNWQISIALIPGLAAREVAVAALGTVYALSASGDDMSGALLPLIAQSWSLPTALSLLVWYVFAPQCLSTLATVKRETNSWRYPLIMLVYLFGMAYLASFITYRLALAWSGG
ncbi:MAG: ferrous iron transporter B [Steroidobacteraceae bacterium]